MTLQFDMCHQGCRKVQKIGGASGGHNLLPLVGIGLTDLPKIGVANPASLLYLPT